MRLRSKTAKLVVSIVWLALLLLMLAPLWEAVILFCVPAMFALWWPARFQAEPGHCRRCGYDLTGNLSGRCPECGERFSSSRL